MLSVMTIVLFFNITTSDYALLAVSYSIFLPLHKNITLYPDMLFVWLVVTSLSTLPCLKNNSTRSQP